MEHAYEIVYFEEEDGRCRTQEFLDELMERSDSCETEADELLLKLLEHGLELSQMGFSKPLRGKHKNLWELIDFCEKRAIRFYYWRSGPTQFTVAWGELKEGTEASKPVLNYALDCYQAWKRKRDALKKPKAARRRKKK